MCTLNVWLSAQDSSGTYGQSHGGTATSQNENAQGATNRPQQGPVEARREIRAGDARLAMGTAIPSYRGGFRP